MSNTPIVGRVTRNGADFCAIYEIEFEGALGDMEGTQIFGTSRRLPVPTTRLYHAHLEKHPEEGGNYFLELEDKRIGVRSFILQMPDPELITYDVTSDFEEMKEQS